MAVIKLANLHIAIVQPKKKRSSDGLVKIGKITQGIVFEDKDGILKVSIDKDGNGTEEELILEFTEKSYDLTGRVNVFTRKLNERGHRVRIIRDSFRCKIMPGLSEQYTPFAPNWVVKGYIVKEGLIKKFDFKDLVGIDGYMMNVFHSDEE